MNEDPAPGPGVDAAGVNELSGPSRDRRTFLRNAGLVGAGVAGATWAAPAVLSLDRAFALGSCCTQGSLNLLAAPFGNNTNLVGPTFTALGTTLTFTRIRNDPIGNTTCTPAATWTTAIVTNCQQGGDSAGQIPITCVGNTNVANAVTIMFGTAVRNLTFTLTDIDASTDAQVQYQEQVSLTWTQGTGTSVPIYTPGANIVNVSPNVYKCNSTTFNAAAGDVTNNLGVDFGCGGSIKSVTVTSSDLNGTLGTSGTNGRYVGIAKIKFCI